jgi:ABC-type iron transport system FetAB ATPase subunit
MPDYLYSDLLGNMVYRNIILPYHMHNRHSEKPKRINEKPKKKCLRNICQNMTNHNGGYCCAECCKEDKKC